jgi:predicted unusual protein kinase regulating ubiquinone biosynthesis (AarF/ABC1/UbiB family)
MYISIPKTTWSNSDTTTPLSNTLQPTRHTTSTQVQPTSSPTQAFDGPITRSRAKKLQQEVHALLYEFQLNTNENFMLPKSCMLILLRFTKEEGQNISKANQQEELYPSQSSAIELSKRNSHIFWFLNAMKAHKYFLESSWSLVSNASKADLIKSTRKAADLL